MIIHTKDIPLLRSSLESLADIRQVAADRVDEIERAVYEDLRAQGVDAACLKFVYASLGERIGVINSTGNHFGSALVCVHVPMIETYLYFSDK